MKLKNGKKMMFLNQYNMWVISCRWGLTEKINNGKKVIKVRLLARGFEEDSSNILKDLSTCTKESVRLILTLLVSDKWPCNAIKIKSAFLQGKQIERPLFLIPSSEFQEENIVWKLKTCIYNLSDASRKWYLGV